MIPKKKKKKKKKKKISAINIHLKSGYLTYLNNDYLHSLFLFQFSVIQT